MCIGAFLDGLAILRSPKDVLIVFVLSVVIWLFEASMYYIIMLGFNFQQPFYVLLLATAAANLFTIAPSTPGYVGVFDFPVRATLTAFGVAESVAISYTLVLARRAVGAGDAAGPVLPVARGPVAGLVAPAQRGAERTRPTPDDDKDRTT